MRPQNISSVKQSSKITSTVHTLYRLGGPYIYGTYAVLPIAEGSESTVLLIFSLAGTNMNDLSIILYTSRPFPPFFFGGGGYRQHKRNNKIYCYITMNDNREIYMLFWNFDRSSPLRELTPPLPTLQPSFNFHR